MHEPPADPKPIEVQIAEALSPPDAVVDRAVAAALDTNVAIPWRRVAAAAVAVVLTLAGWRLLGRETATAPGLPAITNAGGRVVLQLPTAEGPDTVAPGERAIVTALPRPLFVNNAHVLLAHVPGREPSLYLIGGRP